jgi:hypothetical protein
VYGCIVLFVDIGRIVDHHCLNFLVMVHESLAMHQFMHTQIFSLPILKLNCIFLYNSCFDNPGYKSEFISTVLDIQLWVMHCLLIYYRDHYACQNYWLHNCNCIFTCICMSCMLNPINLIIPINVNLVMWKRCIHWFIDSLIDWCL